MIIALFTQRSINALAPGRVRYDVHEAVTKLRAQQDFFARWYRWALADRDFAIIYEQRRTTNAILTSSSRVIKEIRNSTHILSAGLANVVDAIDAGVVSMGELVHGAAVDLRESISAVQNELELPERERRKRFDQN